MITLTCTDTEFHSLHEDINKVRSNSKTVKVNKQALINLLIDHSNLLEVNNHETIKSE